MELFNTAVVFILGLIIGSFLNVVIYRLHTGKSLNGRSHCLSCGTPLRWFELFPLLSYVLLRAKCRNCASFIPSRYLFVEVLTGISFVLLWLHSGSDLVLLALYAFLVAILIVISIYDIRHTIIPDEMTILVSVTALLFLVYGYILVPNLEVVLAGLLSGLGAFIFFWGLWYISKGRWIGLGDAKLAFPLCVIAGYPEVFSVVVISFWIGALLSLSYIGIQFLLKKGKTTLGIWSTPLTIRSEVPFAPFLIMGFVLVEFFNANIFDITLVLFRF